MLDLDRIVIRPACLEDAELIAMLCTQLGYRAARSQIEQRLPTLNFNAHHVIYVATLPTSEVLFQRFKVRSESGERHLGHVDRLNYDEFNLTLTQGGYEALEASERVLEIDTTDFARINYCKLFESIGDRFLKNNR